MSLKELLGTMSTSRYLVRPLMLAVEPRILKARRQVEKTLSDTFAIPTGVDLQVVHKRLTDAFLTDQWTNLRNQDWRHACHCLAMGDRPLIGEIRFITVYLNKLKELSSRSAIVSLIHFYLHNFSPQHPGIQKIAAFLAEQAIGRDWAWKERHEETSIFHPIIGPSTLAKKALDHPESPIKYLESVGFEGSLAAVRIVGYAFLRALEDLQHGLEENGSIQAIEKIAGWGLNKDGDFRYASVPRTRARLAEALLLPWQNRDPSPGVRAYIERFLLEHYRDVRVDASRWNDVSEGAKQVLRRWLTKASLEQFLQIVDLTAASVDARRMWPARRKFWYAFYRRGYMREAWVVFARDGVVRGSAIADSDTNRFLPFGRSVGSGFQANHAVLIMRIGDVTVADWSHMGKCHIWTGNNSKAPKLYSSQYYRHELTSGSDFEQVHIGYWQDSVYKYLNRLLRVPLNRHEYFESNFRS